MSSSSNVVNSKGSKQSSTKKSRTLRNKAPLPKQSKSPILKGKISPVLTSQQRRDMFERTLQPSKDSKGSINKQLITGSSFEDYQQDISLSRFDSQHQT